MPELILGGCQPEPLAAYLKGLGVLRLVAEQKDPDARVAWRNEALHLRSTLDEAALVEFFSAEYKPTPIIGPWAGGCGFFVKDETASVEAVKAVAAIETSSIDRLGDFREAIAAVRSALRREYGCEKPDQVARDAKVRLLRLYRASLPDKATMWLDAVAVLGDERSVFSPLLGTGGNDGRMNFSVNFMQRLVELGFSEGLTDGSASWLNSSLFGDATAGLRDCSIGQFDPGHGGGANSGQGVGGSTVVNPWDYVLMLEGSLLLAGAAARRYGLQSRGRAAFPFTVTVTAVSDSAATASDVATGRKEIWLPLWETWASLPELKLLFSEGRATVGRAQVREGVDFARAIASLGVDRGFSEFVRFGFLRRNGLAYLAVPSGRFKVHRDPTVDLLDDVDAWLAFYRRALGEHTPPRFATTLRRLEKGIMDHSRYGGPKRLADILCALGAMERELSRVPDHAGMVGERSLSPVPLLSPQWRRDADDDSLEFEIAATLASIGTEDLSVDRQVEATSVLRENLEPVTVRGRRLAWSTASRCLVSRERLVPFARAAMERRLLDHGPDGLEAARALSRVAVAAFLAGAINDDRVLDLLWGLILVRPGHGSATRGSSRTAGSAHPLPRSYALLKLVFLPPSRALISSSGETVRPDAAILAHLRNGDLAGACRLAARKLHGAGFVPLPGPTSGGHERFADYVGDVDPHRLEAALLLPIEDVGGLCRLALRPVKLVGA
jgi:CRISPR-associated protein Csx17